ncbi:SIS domain-containing protein [Vagococcus silagei]|uniref:SIS domain-containing protein n=1 Tax=Vagococcus silagei TaxID=2508885 RepID=A0A4S3B5J5_9ENTE|nr:SIS domain-containing protein [Vagococcus silagei]THB62374.1 SIS domain-containing protein [Vagococcus silagei]
MLDWNTTELDKIGATITTQEISQQPKLWQEALAIFKENEAGIENFIETFKKEAGQKIRVIFTGAGTSAYVGDVVRPHLTRFGDNENFIFEAIPTTDIVSAPYSYFKPAEPTLLVSFARSGNSPESVATIDLANQLVKDIKHLVITCAPEGKLAQNAKDDNDSFVLLMPELSNDKGFAMTGSFSCMTLSALLTFDKEHKNHDEIVNAMVSMGTQALAQEELIQSLVDQKFDRVVYLGSGSLSGLTREAQLKLLELTAGRITTAFDSSLGFRHGPKSFVDEETLVFGFISNDAYTQQYDVDILEEIKGNDIAAKTVAIAQNDSTYTGETIVLKDDTELTDGFLALPFVMVAQVVSLLASIKVGNKPDTPSPTGTVNRVVKGVTIHSL